MKYLMPWEVSYTDYNGTPCYAIYSVSHVMIASTYINHDGMFYCWFCVSEAANMSVECFKTPEDAIIACNIKLTELGYEFIEPDRAEKLRLLL